MTYHHGEVCSHRRFCFVSPSSAARSSTSTAAGGCALWSVRATQRKKRKLVPNDAPIVLARLAAIQYPLKCSSPVRAAALGIGSAVERGGRRQEVQSKRDVAPETHGRAVP